MYVYESTCTMYTALYVLRYVYVLGLLTNDNLRPCLSTQDPVQIAIEQENGDIVTL